MPSAEAAREVVWRRPSILLVLLGSAITYSATYFAEVPLEDNWSTMAAVFSVSNLAYALLARHFPPQLAGRANTALDGIDIWPLLTGAKKELDRDVLLYFDDWQVQCARWQRWKLHFARYNSVAYSPAPPGGRINLPLSAPELYDLERDPDESYDVAAAHPDIVAQIRARVDRLIEGFPEEVRKAYAATKAVQVAPTPAGALPSRAVRN